MRRLEPTEVESYRRDGFILVRSFFSADEIARVSGWLEEVKALAGQAPELHCHWETAGDGVGRLLRQVENICPVHPEFHEFSSSAEMLTLVGQLLGSDAVLFKDKVNFKLPGGAGYLPHRDGRFWWKDPDGKPLPGWDVYASDFVSALIAVDRCTTENGCLEVVAGRHTAATMPEEYGPLSEAEAQDMKFMPCPSEPADIVLFSALAPHRSGPNRSRHPRRVLYLTYNPRKDGDQRERYFADKQASLERQGIEHERDR